MMETSSRLSRSGALCLFAEASLSRSVVRSLSVICDLKAEGSIFSGSETVEVQIAQLAFAQFHLSTPDYRETERSSRNRELLRGCFA